MCIHTYMHASTHTCMHAYIHTYMHTYKHIRMHIRIHKHTRIHIRIRIRIHQTHKHTYTHTRTYMHEYIHTYTHTCIHAYIHTSYVHAYILCQELPFNKDLGGSSKPRIPGHTMEILCRKPLSTFEGKVTPWEVQYNTNAREFTDPSTAKNLGDISHFKKYCQPSKLDLPSQISQEMQYIQD